MCTLFINVYSYNMDSNICLKFDVDGGDYILIKGLVRWVTKKFTASEEHERLVQPRERDKEVGSLAVVTKIVKVIGRMRGLARVVLRRKIVIEDSTYS